MDDEGYVRFGEVMADLQVVNGMAEHCIKDLTEYANFSRDSAHYEDIFVVLSDHSTL